MGENGRGSATTNAGATKARSDAAIGAASGSAPGAAPDAAVGDSATKQAPAADDASSPDSLKSLDDPGNFINRELSSLAFQRRVLQEADDERNPLLERVKFLAILGSNLDEFFMVRMAGLHQQVDAGVVDVPPDGMTPAEQLAAARRETLELMSDGRSTWSALQAHLKRVGIHVRQHDELSKKQTAAMAAYFRDVVFPVLTPLAFDPARPFPHISNLSLNMAVILRDEQGDTRFARVKVPGTLPRLVPLKRSSGGHRRDGTVPRNHYFAWLEQVIAAHIDALFPGMEVLEVHPFHVTRDADNEIQELEASDLLESIEQSVRERRFGSVVRLSVTKDMSKETLGLLVREMKVDPNDVFVVDSPLALGSLVTLYQIDRHDLKFPGFVPALPPQLEVKARAGDIFAAIRKGDILLHHPFDSFGPVEEFLATAAQDPDVLAIKQTLYRVGRDSPVVDALLQARENGKQVSVLVELKARFDEESNIVWARMLEREGVHVVYGLLGLKTHSKVALVARREGDEIRRYVHLATGNYNHVTAHLYTDMGLFTCDRDIGADASDLFNYLTGYSAKSQWRKLLVAPINLRSRMEDLIRREIEHAQAGRKAQLVFKMNAIVDRGMIRLLYEASGAGVRIDLIVRGICGLRPGVEDLSENIRVRSIVGRFLEHSRVFYFRNGGKDEVYLGSADLMPRNIDRRVEVIFPVESRSFVRRLREDVLALYLADNRNARLLQPDGTWIRAEPEPGEEPIDAQQRLIDAAAARSHAATRPRAEDPGRAPGNGSARRGT